MLSPVVDSTISVVRAEEADAEVLAEISKRAFDSDVEVGASGRGGPPGYDPPKAQKGNMRWTAYYKILLDDRVVGAIMVCERNEGHCEICGLFVDPDFHNQGIATRAFELIWGAYPAVEVWTLGTPGWNVRTKCFYEKLGFRQVGWTKDPNGRPTGRWYEKLMGPSKPFKALSISELRDGMNGVAIEGKVTGKEPPRQVRSKKRGEMLTVANATLEDGSSSVALVLWNEQVGHVSAGDKVRVENGYIGSYQDALQLNIGKFGKLVFPM